MNKKGMILSLVVILLLSVAVLGQAKDLKVRVLVEKARVKLKPDLIRKIIAQVPKGTILQSEGKNGEWYLVSLPAEEKGFVISGYIHQSVVEEIVEEIREVPTVNEEKPPAAPPSEIEYNAPKKVEKGPMLAIGVIGGYAMPSEEKYGSGLKYGGNIYFNILKYIAIEISGQRFQSNVEGDTKALSKGKLSIMPIQLSIQGRIPISSQFTPYILVGGTYNLNSFSIDSGINSSWNTLGFDIKEEVENAMGFHFGAGIDFFFTKNIALNADIRYCIAKIKGSWTLTDQVSGTETSADLKDLNIGNISFGVGVKFCL